MDKDPTQLLESWQSLVVGGPSEIGQKTDDGLRRIEVGRQLDINPAFVKFLTQPMLDEAEQYGESSNIRVREACAERMLSYLGMPIAMGRNSYIDLRDPTISDWFSHEIRNSTRERGRNINLFEKRFPELFGRTIITLTPVELQNYLEDIEKFRAASQIRSGTVKTELLKSLEEGQQPSLGRFQALSRAVGLTALEQMARQRDMVVFTNGKTIRGVDELSSNHSVLFSIRGNIARRLGVHPEFVQLLDHYQIYKFIDRGDIVADDVREACAISVVDYLGLPDLMGKREFVDIRNTVYASMLRRELKRSNPDSEHAITEFPRRFSEFFKAIDFQLGVNRSSFNDECAIYASDLQRRDEVIARTYIDFGVYNIPVNLI